MKLFFETFIIPIHRKFIFSVYALLFIVLSQYACGFFVNFVRHLNQNRQKRTPSFIKTRRFFATEEFVIHPFYLKVLGISQKNIYIFYFFNFFYLIFLDLTFCRQVMLYVFQKRWLLIVLCHVRTRRFNSNFKVASYFFCERGIRKR